jgi:hypothetical protein
MYAEEKTSTGAFGSNHQLNTASLDIRDGKLHGKPYVGIVSITAKVVILRGGTRDTEAQARECFIDTVLLIGAQRKKKLEAQRDAYNVRHFDHGRASLA